MFEILFPSINVQIYKNELGIMYHLFVNGIFEGCYVTQSDLMYRINFIIQNELYKGVSDANIN